MSEHPEEEEKIVFHYSREARLKKASERVKRLNEPRQTKRPGFFRILTANRSLAMLLIAILMLSATLIVTNLLIPSADTADFQGNELRLSAFRFGGETYIALKKKERTKNAYIGPVHLYVRVQGRGSFSLSTDVLFSAAETEEFKFKMQDSGERIEAAVEVLERRILLKASTQ